MGIDFSHCTAHWSYSGFHAFRQRLAKKIGITLDGMDGFRGSLSWDSVKDPIVPLLNHSDCDGELLPADCRKVIPRLLTLISDWDNDYDRKMAEELITGMKKAIKENKPLRFR